MTATARPARREDVPRVLELMRELAVYERLEDMLSVTAEQLAFQIFEPEAWPRVECLVAEDAGGIVGYALFYGCYSSFRGEPVIWLEDLIVTGSRRGTGAGRVLMRELARLAIERGCARVAWSVLDWNRPSIDFYERLGATHAADWLTYTISGEALAALAG